MNRQPDPLFDGRIADWLEADPTTAPDPTLDIVLAAFPLTRQRRRTPWFGGGRFRPMTQQMKLALSALAVVAVVGGAVIVLGPPGGGVGGPAATPATTVAPTAPPSPTPSAASLDEHEGGPLAPGSYAIDALAPIRITFTVPGGWRKNVVTNMIWTEDSEAALGFATLENLYVDPCDPTLGAMTPPVGPTVDDLVAALAQVPGLTASATDASLGGVAGKEITFSGVKDWAACNPGDALLFLAGDGQTDRPAPDADDARYNRIWILDVDGHRLLVHAGARPGATDTERADLEAMLDSLVIEIVEPAASAAS